MFDRDFDFAAEEQAEHDRCASVGVRIGQAIEALTERTAKTMAEAAYEVVKQMSLEDGQDPSYECFMRTPEDSHKFGGGTGGIYVVCWESGPYQWGPGATAHAYAASGKLVETYWGFDLLFYPAEDAA